MFENGDFKIILRFNLIYGTNQSESIEFTIVFTKLWFSQYFSASVMWKIQVFNLIRRHLKLFNVCIQGGKPLHLSNIISLFTDAKAEKPESG